MKNKVKSKRALIKRIIFNKKNGKFKKIKIFHAFTSHLAANKKKKQKRKLRKSSLLSKSDFKRIKQLIQK